MELQQLRYFVALARTGNFTRAAERCHVTQPSLSQQVRKLEEEIGQELLVRRMNQARTTLTEAGEILHRHAVRILAEVDEAQKVMRALPKDHASAPAVSGMNERVVTPQKTT